MKASEFFKPATEQFREQLTGGGVKVALSELKLPDIWVFPPQAEEIAFLYADDINGHFDQIHAARMIASRGKTESGMSMFDDHNEKVELVRLMTNAAPKEYTPEVARRIIDDINKAFPIATLAEAEKNSEAATS